MKEYKLSKMREYHQKAQCPRSNNKNILEKEDGGGGVGGDDRIN